MKFLTLIALGIFLNVANTSSALANDAADVLICLRELVNDKGSQESISFAYSTMVKLQADINNDRLIQDTMNACDLMKSQIMVKENLSEQEQLNIAHSQGAGGREAPNLSLKYLLASFIKPQLYCDSFTGGLDIAALLAVRIAGGYRICTNLDGRRWLRLFVSPGAGYGWAVNVGQTHGTSTDKEISKDNVHFATSYSEAIGSGRGGTEVKEFMADDHKSSYLTERGPWFVGFGAAHTAGVNLAFTAFRLSLDRNYLLCNFLNKSSRCPTM